MQNGHCLVLNENYFSISPVIFLLYIDGLLVRLAKVNVGCYVGTFFTGALAYAHDIVLFYLHPLHRLCTKCFRFVMNMLLNSVLTSMLISPNVL